MFNKNLKFYRLKQNLTKKDLAAIVGITPMAITHYESGERKPSMDIIKALATALGVRVSDFLSRRNENLAFTHGEFRKNSKLTEKQQEYLRESVEEYVSRFYAVVEILGGEVLPKAPVPHQLPLSGNPEQDALEMRKYLRLSENGPVGNLVEILENRGIILYVSDITCDDFSGMNGLVNNRPYIVVNGNMTTERIRSTLAHEMAHLLFCWDDTMPEKEAESLATAISGAFLFPAIDAKRELGLRRTRIANDMIYTCKEYGISMYLLVKRANLCSIINDSVAKDFYIQAGKFGWKKHEPSRVAEEKPMLFAQLVCRAVSEEEITVQKGAELLKMPYEDVVKQCFGEEE